MELLISIVTLVGMGGFLLLILLLSLGMIADLFSGSDRPVLDQRDLNRIEGDLRDRP